jgi:hypothetical protein
MGWSTCRTPTADGCPVSSTRLGMELPTGGGAPIEGLTQITAKRRRRPKMFALCSSLLLALAIGVGAGISSASTAAGVLLDSTDPGATVHVDATGPCPSTLGNARDVSNEANALGAHLLPSHPQFGIICWYRSTPGLPYAWVHRSLVNYPTAIALAGAIDGLDTARPSGVFHCPPAFADAAVLAFGYLKNESVDLWFADSGCETLNNSVLTAYGYGPGAATFARYSSLALGLLPLDLGGTERSSS